MHEGRRWVVSQRNSHRAGARPLSEEERSGLSPFFRERTLDLVRIKLVPRIENPPFFTVIRQAGLEKGIDFQSASGMTFLDTILVSQRHMPPRVYWMSLLFHEMVHVVQYQILGLQGFVEQYVHGWAKNGFDYFAIPLERKAYELQKRYDEAPDRAFPVAENLRRRTAMK
jgi:hypothetical protein